MVLRGMSLDFLNKWARGRLEKGRWLVGVSGGGDSVALLKLLLEAGFGERLVVGNFEHGWGSFGIESAAFVAALAEKMGLEFRVGKGSGKAATNAEAVARDERYVWFAQVCAAEGLDGVLVAHTSDDAVETFLMRMGKGSGLQGLTGITTDNVLMGVRVIRPLLSATRDELRGYLHTQGQTWMEDPDNAAGGSQRARIRQLMPMMEAAGIKMQGVRASMAALSSASRTLDVMVDGQMRDITWLADDKAAEWEQAAAQRVLPETGARILGRLMVRLVPEMGVVRRSKRVALLARLQQEDAGHATLGGLKFEWKNGVIFVKKEHADE